MPPPASAPVTLQPETWEEALADLCARLIQEKEKKQILLCITGKSGAGKSTLGKRIRKRGLPGIPPRKIGVIDDGILAVPLLGLFTRRIKSKARVKDDLAPFAHWLRKKNLVVYVNVTPHQRVTRCDVVLRLRLPEEERRRRLIQRELHGEARFDRTLHASDEVTVPADHVFDLCFVAAHDRPPSEDSAKSVPHTAAS